MKPHLSNQSYYLYSFSRKKVQFHKNGEFWSIFDFVWMMKITIFDWLINHHFSQITKSAYFHVGNFPFGFGVEMTSTPLTSISFHTWSYKGVIAVFSIGGYFLRNVLTFTFSMSSWLLRGITLLYKHKGVITKF